MLVIPLVATDYFSDVHYCKKKNRGREARHPAMRNFYIGLYDSYSDLDPNRLGNCDQLMRRVVRYRSSRTRGFAGSINSPRRKNVDRFDRSSGLRAVHSPTQANDRARILGTK